MRYASRADRLAVPAQPDTIAALKSFVPTGDESEDVARLFALTDELGSPEQVRAAVPALLGIFERFPHALLGAPGPVVHCIERVGLEGFLPALLRSFGRHPARMTLWMIERCLSSNPSASSRLAILQALRGASSSPDAADLRADIEEILGEHGAPARP